MVGEASATPGPVAGPGAESTPGWAAIETSAHSSALIASLTSSSAASFAAGGSKAASGVSRVSLAASFRERPLGTVVDEGGRVARRHGRAIFTVTSLILIPAAIAEVFAARAVRDRFLNGENPLGSFRIAFTSSSSNDAGVLTAFVSLGLTAFAALLIGAYVAAIVADDRLGRVVGQRAAVIALLKRLPALTAAWVITHLWILLVFWAGQANSGLAALVAVLAVPFALLSTYLAPVMMLEGLNPVAGTRRAWQLARQTFGSTFGFFTLSSLVGLWFRFGLALFPAVIRSVAFTDRYQWLVEGVGAQVGIILSAPIVACATVVMYIEVRTRTEGMDLFLECDRVLPDAEHHG